jgi:hypothetical protein
MRTPGPDWEPRQEFVAQGLTTFGGVLVALDPEWLSEFD